MNRPEHQHPVQRGDAFVDEFHRQLGRLVHAHAGFDFNVGLQLNWLGRHCQIDVSELLDPRRSQLGLRLKTLKRLVLDVFGPAGENAAAEFEAWFDRADECRAVRNDYVHGRWGVPGEYDFKGEGRMIDAEPLLTFTALHWNMGPDRAEDSVSMRLGEFSSQVDTVERLFGDYFQLTQNHLEFAKAGRAPSA
jgi:hypothetical protein